MGGQRLCVYVTPYFPGPGSWRGGFAYDAVRALQAHGEDVRVLLATASAGGAYVYGGVEVVPFRHREGFAQAFQFLFSRANAAAFASALSRLAADGSRPVTVHLNTPALAPYAEVAKRLFPKARTIVQFHQSGLPISFACGRFGRLPVLSALKRRLQLSAVARADELRFVSEAQCRRFLALEEVRRALASGDRAVTVRHNPVDGSLFAPGRRAPHEGAPITVGCVANFFAWKGQDALIRAAARLRSGCSARDFRFVFLGSGPTLVRCRELAARLGLGDTVGFLPERDHLEMPEFYRSLDLLVLPSSGEAFGSVCAEAKACGVPFAVSEDAGVAETMTADERERLTFAAGDADAIASVIARAAGATLDPLPGVCWWTVFPTPNQDAICRALRADGIDVRTLYYGRLDSYRRMLGWRERPLSPWELAVPDVASARRALPDFDSRLQMVPGYCGRFRARLMREIRRRGLAWFAVTEASSGRLRTYPALVRFAAEVASGAWCAFAHGLRAQRQLIATGLADDRLEWLGYAIDPPAPRPPRAESAGCVFVFAGALTERKGADTLAAVWRDVVAAHPESELRLIGDGPLASAFDGLANVIRLGALPPGRVADEMAKGDVIVMPSRYDPWGVALTEGASLGLAMVATPEAGASEMVEPGVNGALASGRGEWVAALCAYAADPALARRHGRAAAESARRLHADALARRLVRKLSVSRDERARDRFAVAAAFWEEHCTECGAPACYATCPKFERGWHGRCRRADSPGLPGDAEATELRETIRGVGAVRLRPWGKLELLFHGRMMPWRTARMVEFADAAARPLWRKFPQLHRSLRWRLVPWLFATGPLRSPTHWTIRVTAERPERLVAEIVDSAGAGVFRAPLDLAVGENAFDFAVPPLGDGYLCRVFAADGGATGRLDFVANALVEGGAAIVAAKGERFVKCLAWDLDGTLWKGILSEDGEAALEIRPEAVALIRTLDERGIVQSVVSRNDPGPALAALRKFGIGDLFVYPQFSWGAKSAGVANLARELGIGETAIAFVDDLPEQRAEVAANCPGVRVFAADEIATLAARPEFDPPVSGESRSRRMRYLEEMHRREIERTEYAGDSKAFLAASDFRLEAFDLASASDEDWRRCEELALRTNRLNLTGRRDALADARDERDAARRAFGFRAGDRFGDYGIVGFARTRRLGDGTARLEEFALSCRVAGKGAERQALAIVKRELGVARLEVGFVETGRNGALKAALGEDRK